MATSANSEIRNEMLSGAQLKFKVEIIDTPIITKCPSEFGKPAISDAKNVLEGFNLQPAKKIIVTGETATAIASEGEVTKTEDSKLEEKLPAESGFSIVQMMFFFILLLVISLVCRRI